MTPEQIAAGLTKAQRRGLLNGDWWRDGRVINALKRKGVVSNHDLFGYELTPLGLAVKAVVEKEENDVT